MRWAAGWRWRHRSPLWCGVDLTTSSLQYVEDVPWIGALNAWYHLGIDGIALPLIVLTAFMTPLVVVAAWDTIDKRPAQYFAAFLVMEGLMIGVFSAADALLFYVFWEAMLIPMFLIIGIWGGTRRVYATIKFFLYTFLGSVLMLVALIWLYLEGGSYEIAAIHRLPLGMTEQILIFLAFFAGMLSTVPILFYSEVVNRGIELNFFLFKVVPMSFGASAKDFTTTSIFRAVAGTGSAVLSTLVTYLIVGIIEEVSKGWVLRHSSRDFFRSGSFNFFHSSELRTRATPA